ncbi:DUF2987 domain-containing protein [Zobellella sp. DQSA1]|uniref:DUF2987 domain-containing protein n=1 Tax=Zobellella sp. DQSA1 TaxID=3342386 RepID=UPI0035C016B4
MKTPVLMAVLALAGTVVQAEPLSLGYSGFYKHMETVAKARVEQATLGFYLSRQDGQGLCHIESGTVQVAGAIRGEVEPLPHGQFLLPFDKQLDLDKAVVILEVEQPQRCDISIRIQAELPAGDTSLAELRQVRDEMHLLLQKMAGWPGKYFVPELKGLHLAPAEPGQSLNGEARLDLSDQQLAAERDMTVPAVRISPWL